MPFRRFLFFALVLPLILSWPSPSSASEPDRFVDDTQNRFHTYLETAAAEGILIGCNPPENDRACPDRTVTRGEMAVMLVRAVDLPHGEGSRFDDVAGHPAEAAISTLAAAGFTNGCGSDRFCPDRSLTRGEMAALIAKTLGWDSPRNTTPYVDLKETPFGPSMVALARRGGLEPCDVPVGIRLCPQKSVTRAEAAYALVAALGLKPSTPTSNESDAPAIGFVDDFESLDLWDGRTPNSRNRVTLTSNGYRGSGLQVKIPKGSHFGADFKLDLSRQVGEEPELLYFRYMLRFDPDWATAKSGKLPGFSGVYGSSGKGGYRSSPSSPGWSARTQFFPTSGDDPRVQLGYYVYHLGQEQRYGESMAWGEAARLVPGEWYCLEGEVRLNTPGLADGALRAWIDETSVFDVSGLAFRRPGEPDIRVNSFWFNVYYGGKQVPDRDLGLAIDEVKVDGRRIGCGAGDGTSGSVGGDFGGDGFEDRLWWGSCVTGDCFRVRTTSTTGKRAVGSLGNGAWFSLATHRVGMASGDLDGDGSDELVYPGRCIGSVGCWRVHHLDRNRWSIGNNWGDGSRFTDSTSAIIVGDWDGDGLDDLVYDGLCGSDPNPCWRVHRSAGDRFLEPEGWGQPGEGAISSPVAADVTGDGLEDLVYPAPCGDDTCWFAQVSSGSGFGEPVRLGKATAAELGWNELFDWDGDGRADIVSIQPSEKTHQIRVRPTGADGLGKGIIVAEQEQRVTDVLLRRTDTGSPVEALVTVGCGEDATCVEYFKAPSMRLLPIAEYHEMVRAQRMTWLACEVLVESDSQLCDRPDNVGSRVVGRDAGDLDISGEPS